MEERWLAIAGLEGRYEISDCGNLRNLPGQPPLKPKHYESKPGGPRYWRVRLPSPVRRDWFIHRLVLTTFARPSTPREQCRHLNGNSLDNRLENLAWGTASDDNYDRVRHGTHQHAKRDHCPNGHPKDGVVLRPDGTVRQRVCKTCQGEARRRRYARKSDCPQGHPLDGVAVRKDGTKVRYCKRCKSESVSRQMIERHASNPRTHCKRGHVLDGGGQRRYCKTCNRERNRVQKAAKRAEKAA